MKRIPASTVAAHPELVLAEETIHNELSHPNIVEHYCTMVDGSNGDVCFLLEFAEGVTLSRLVKDAAAENRRVGEELASAIVAQLVLALRYLHGLDIAHRDVKPDNIILTRTMQVKLLDFGLATFGGDEVLARETGGTVLYLAPETLIHTLWLDPRAGDLYALGLVSYFLLTSVHYFGSSASDPYRLLELRRSRPFEPIKLTRSARLNGLLELLLEADPRLRWNHVYGSFGTFASLPIFSNVDWGRLGAGEAK